jgi:signal transduction histidine kinase
VIVALVLLGLIAFVSWRAVDRGLRPAHRLAAKLDAIDVQHVPERLEAGELPAELQPVADKSDALIQRVHAALERERRTTADIAHELRTPLSELLTVSEVALRDGRDARAMSGALRTVRNVAWRMGRSVSTLLKLARLEMGAEAPARETVDLGALVAEVLRSLASLERERELRVVNTVEPGELVGADADALRIVVSNLLSNALYYSPPRATVECRLDTEERGWRFTVENEAVDLKPEDLRALAQPFWRKDRARSDSNRSGLGLALSRSLAETSGLTLTFELEAGRFRAVLRGPSSASSKPGARRMPVELRVPPHP